MSAIKDRYPDCEHQDESHISCKPQSALSAHADAGLDEKRIDNQGKQTPRVARRVEKVRIARRHVPRSAYPVLKKRCRRRDHEERNRSRYGQSEQQLPRGVEGKQLRRTYGESNRKKC